jgi:hypothetical protein
VSADKVKIRVAATNDLPPETVVTIPDNFIHTSDGRVVGRVRELVDALMNSDMVRNYFVKEGTEEHKWAEDVWEPRREHIERRLFMKKIEPEVLRQIESVHIAGTCKVEISQFGLRHSKLGDVHIAWGKTSIAGTDALAVATVEPSGEKKLSINFSTPTPKVERDGVTGT